MSFLISQQQENSDAKFVEVKQIELLRVCSCELHITIIQSNGATIKMNGKILDARVLFLGLEILHNLSYIS